MRRTATLACAVSVSILPTYSHSAGVEVLTTNGTLVAGRALGTGAEAGVGTGAADEQAHRKKQNEINDNRIGN